MTRVLLAAPCLFALALAARPVAADGCVTESCHADLKVDAPHQKKGVDCARCHLSIKDGRAPHKDALDAEPPELMCAQKGCHPSETEKQRASSHKESVCESCHGASHGEFTRTDTSACKGCHGDEHDALEQSIHRKGDEAVECVDCHGDMHDVKGHEDPASPMSKVLQVSTCGECHDEAYVRAFRTSVHGVGLLRSGLSVAPTCSDCHGAHDIAKAKTASSTVSKLNAVETCGDCHEFILARWRRSAHGARWVEDRARQKAGQPPITPARGAPGPKEGPGCTSCHPGHLTFDPMILGNHLKMADRCGECHAAADRTYRASYHGKATRLGLGAAATCADCHTPHEMLPAKDPRSSVNPKNLQKTCGRCHSPINAEFVKFDAHMDPTNPARDWRVFAIWAFMTTLLVGVLGLFALHALLWFQRSVVALRRGELAHAAIPGEPWVRRFSPFHVALHGVVVSTFLVLAATGLPLKFSGAGWARVIEGLFGGPAVTGVVHRIAGVVTFGYALAFVGYLLREIVLRRRRGLLAGWQSMVPRLKDLQDLLANARWFLYRGPQPRLDRWSYWEKFDFFAVFWGIPVIGLSGLLLWKPLFFTTFLPAWVINAAYVVHSDEALLATGFIFFFHFFHTHLRPEAFPLDTVVFLGGMPLSRFQRERPAEYERAVADGTLDGMLMPAPSERATRRAARIGAVALAIGLLLGVLLLATGLPAVLR